MMAGLPSGYEQFLLCVNSSHAHARSLARALPLICDTPAAGADGSLQKDKLQKLRNGSDLIEFPFRGNLSQREPELQQTGIDQVHGAECLCTIVTALHGLAINRHVILFFRVDARLFFRRITQRVQPAGKTGLKRIDL